MVVMDEAFSYQDDRHEQALLPAMQTIRDAQMWVVSTAGDFSSTYLRRKVEAGRRRVEAGVQAGPAYFEWAAPEDCDYTDPAVWARANPALNRTTHESTVRHAFESMDAPEFRRAMLNMWDSTEMDAVIPLELWARVSSSSAHPTEKVYLGVDAPPERDRAVVVAADARNVEVLRQDRGLEWVAPYLEGLVRDRKYLGVGCARHGPADPWVETFARRVRWPPVSWYNTATLGRAEGLFEDGVVNDLVRIQQSPHLTAAMLGCEKFSYHQGRGWIWKRRKSDQTQDISPMLASAMAYDLAQLEERAPRSRPKIHQT